MLELIINLVVIGIIVAVIQVLPILPAWVKLVAYYIGGGIALILVIRFLFVLFNIVI